MLFSAPPPSCSMYTRNRCLIESLTRQLHLLCRRAAVKPHLLNFGNVRTRVELRHKRLGALHIWSQGGVGGEGESGGGGSMEMKAEEKKKKTVAVIGAGPSGLVAAKSMLEVGLSPILFDEAAEIGGMWNPKNNSSDKGCWDTLKTNVSRHSCCFSDFPWDSSAPLFPSQRLMCEYLEGYAQKFLQPEHISLGSEITGVSRRDGRWVVHWSTALEREGLSKEFDFVVFASGFFGKPYSPNLPGIDAFRGEVMHSSEYRGPETFRGKKVVVVGASFSSSEVAAEVSFCAAQVVNIVSGPAWVVPRFIAAEPGNPATPFFPLDLVFYRHSSCKQQPSSAEEENKMQNGFLRMLCGDQGVLNLSPELDSNPPYVVISDDYMELVRSNRIEVKLGRVQKLQSRGVILEDQTVVDDVDSVIFCTGFQPSLPYLSSELLDVLRFDSKDRFLPAPLHFATFHPSLPGAAFVGFFRGAPMGVMELQARWAAAIFSGDLPPIPDSVQQQVGIAMERRLQVSTPRPQFPHGDYVRFSNALAAELKVLPSEDWRDKHDILIPAHFRPGSAAETALAVLEKDCRECSEGKMVPNAVFRSLAGSWTLHREIDNRMDASQCGIVTGTATFTPSASSSHEYLYSEIGELALVGGKRFKVFRKYVYAFDTLANRIDVFFEDQGARGSPFHSLSFLPSETSAAGENEASMEESSKISRGWRAEGQHLCVKDMYYPSYLFEFGGNSLAKMEISYNVVGPQKNYTSIATYVR